MKTYDTLQELIRAELPGADGVGLVNRMESRNSSDALAATILMRDPETGEILRPVSDPKDTGKGKFELVVGNRGGTRKWKHTIHTEEV